MNNQNGGSPNLSYPNQPVTPAPRRSFIMGVLKKSVAFLLAGIIMISICGCGETEEKGKKSAESKSSESNSAITGNTPSSVVKGYAKAAYKPDYKTADSCLLKGGEDYCKYLADQEGKDLDEYFEYISDGEASSYKEYCKYQDEKMKEKLEEGDNDSGENIELDKIEIKKDKRISKSKLKSIKKQYEDDDYIDADKITDAREIKVEITLRGDDGSASNTATVTVVKYNGKWKLIA